MHVKADLHIHTNHSDGELSPQEIVHLCHKFHLQTIAIADHDTVSGVPAAIKAGKEIGLNIIPAIEISAQHNPGTLHMLGYFKEFPAKLEDELKFLQTGRQERLPKIIKLLNDLDLQITVDEVVAAAGNGQVGRPHVAKVLLSKGYVRSFEEAFAKFLGKGQPAYVDKTKMAWPEAIKMIHNHDGIAVLAHPFSLEMQDHELLDLIAEMQGLDGIEVFHSQHTKAQKRLYKRIARQHNLVLTGGTDFHAANGLKPGQHGIDQDRLEKLINRLNY